MLSVRECCQLGIVGDVGTLAVHFTVRRVAVQMWNDGVGRLRESCCSNSATQGGNATTTDLRHPETPANQ